MYKTYKSAEQQEKCEDPPIQLTNMQNEVLRLDGSMVCVGDRLQSDDQYATVMYIGPISGTKGTWLGVEWDDSERGKHDGSHDGHRYFQASHPKSGSFIRYKKANFGTSFMSAVRDRYGLSMDEDAGVITEDLYVVGGQNKLTVVEMVGAKKVNVQQSELDKLKEVVLRGMLVYGTAPADPLCSLVPSITILDISQNLVSSWKTVADIAKQLENLKSLNVSENILEFPGKPDALCSSFSHVKVLFINRMPYTWKQIVQCTSMFTSLEQLHACFNSINSLGDVTGHLQTLKLINLESNKLTDWSEILKLGALPQLETMIMTDNGLSCVQFLDTPPSATTNHFKKLKSVTISHNSISEWSSINELNKLCCLEELRWKSNPLLDTETPETIRQLVIAKLKHLKILNRTEVTQEERKSSEIDYLKRFGPAWVKSGGSQDTEKNNPSPEFVATHPRFQELIQVWEAPEDSEMQQKATTLKSSLISLKITCPSLPDKKMLEKKVPETMTIQKLKALIHRLYRLDQEITLTYISKQMNGQEIGLDNDQRYLSYYSIEPGDVIQVKL